MLPGGLTNTNYRVDAASGSYVVRRWSPSWAGLLDIDRDAEHHNTVAAAEAGVGAPGDRLPARAAGPGAALHRGPHALGAPTCERRAGWRRSPPSAGRSTVGGASSASSTCSTCSAATWAWLTRAASRLPDGYRSYAAKVEEQCAWRCRGARPGAGIRPLSQRPACRELHRRRRAPVARRLRVLGQRRPRAGSSATSGAESNLSLAQLEELVTCYYGEPRRSRVASRAPVGRDVEVRLDAVGGYPGRLVHAGLRLLVMGDARSNERAVAELESDDPPAPARRGAGGRLSVRPWRRGPCRSRAAAQHRSRRSSWCRRRRRRPRLRRRSWPPAAAMTPTPSRSPGWCTSATTRPSRAIEVAWRGAVIARAPVP